MTTDVAWLLIMANAVIAAVTIANTWMLAWYGRRPRKRQGKGQPEETKSRSTSQTLQRGLLYGLIVLLSVITIVYSLLKPNPDTNLQILQIALSIGLAVLALAFSVIAPLVAVTRDQSDMIAALMKLDARFLESTLRKSPNNTVDTDARDDGARG